MFNLDLKKIQAGNISLNQNRAQKDLLVPLPAKGRPLLLLLGNPHSKCGCLWCALGAPGSCTSRALWLQAEQLIRASLCTLQLHPAQWSAQGRAQQRCSASPEPLYMGCAVNVQWELSGASKPLETLNGEIPFPSGDHFYTISMLAVILLPYLLNDWQEWGGKMKYLYSLFPL